MEGPWKVHEPSMEPPWTRREPAMTLHGARAIALLSSKTVPAMEAPRSLHGPRMDAP